MELCLKEVENVSRFVCGPYLKRFACLSRVRERVHSVFTERARARLCLKIRNYYRENHKRQPKRSCSSRTRQSLVHCSLRLLCRRRLIERSWQQMVVRRCNSCSTSHPTSCFWITGCRE